MNIFRGDAIQTNGGPSGDGLSQIKYAKIAATSNGSNAVVTAVAGKKIRVLSMNYQVTDAGNGYTWLSRNTPISGTIINSTGRVVEIESEFGVMETATGEALVLNNGVNTDINGTLTYVEV